MSDDITPTCGHETAVQGCVVCDPALVDYTPKCYCTECLACIGVTTEDGLCDRCREMVKDKRTFVSNIQPDPCKQDGCKRPANGSNGYCKVCQ